MLHRNIGDGARHSRSVEAGGCSTRRRRSGCADTLLDLRYASSVVSQNSRRAVRSRPRGEDIVEVNGIIAMLIVGAVAGWLAGQIVRGFGFGLIGNIILGIVGAFIGGWLLRALRIEPFPDLIGSIVNGTIGAVVLLVIVGFLRR